MKAGDGAFRRFCQGAQPGRACGLSFSQDGVSQLHCSPLSSSLQHSINNKGPWKNGSLILAESMSQLFPPTSFLFLSLKVLRLC